MLVDGRPRQLPDLVRASVHYYNTEEEAAGATTFARSLSPFD